MAAETHQLASCSSYNYEVFLSFRGKDTRTNFTDHMYHALDRAGIRTCKDNEDIKQGEEIEPKLLKAIKESRISIPIFSKNYASSKWCLRELAKIMECKETDGQVVWPIFYKVEPSDVRNQTGSFAEAFLQHEETQSKETLDKWREALSKAGNLSGWDSEDLKNSYETNMIDSIVEKALSVLSKTTIEVAKHPIGIDSRVEEVMRLIDIESKDVQFMGIHGIGGIGKTTIAKAVFNRISRHFQGRCFLPDVRERASQYNGLVNLQNELVSKVLNINKMHISIVDEGINLIKERFCSKKVLIILDDVDQDEQLDKLAGGCNWFGPGSTIIITTRDKHILNVDRVSESKIYMPNVLDANQSLQLFSNHAFGRDHPPQDFRELSKQFLGIIGGLPLALEVLGSFLRDKRRPMEWKSALEKLNKIPDAKVQGSLQISYDGLEDEDKEIFLDIACFFIGMDEETVIHILEDNSPRIRIKVLVLKSLVRIDHDNKLTMHDLLRDMGREIVRQKNPKNLGKRSRLWSHEEALHVLKKGKGTRYVEGLVLNFKYKSNDQCLRIEAFEGMSELRLLQIDNANLEGNFENFPGELKWLSWKGLPLGCIPAISHLEKLSVLDLSTGRFTENWRGWQHIQLIKTLKVLDLSDCLCLTRTPDFSSLTNLERLILDGCLGLVVCHESIGQLKNLVFLSLKWCRNLMELPDSICKLSSLRSLILYRCLEFKKLPKELGTMKSLTELIIDETNIEELPDAIGSLEELEKLSVRGCKKLVELPAGFSCLSRLQTLDVSCCTQLQALPELPSSLIKLNAKGCSSMERLQKQWNLKFLQELDHLDCEKQSQIQGIGGLPLLQKLELSYCVALQSLPKLPSSLVTLDISECISMERLPNLSNLKNLEHIFLDNCEKLVKIQGMKGLTLLRKLHLTNCRNLSEIQGISCLPLLQRLHLQYCTKLQSLPKLPSSLIRLEAYDCSSMERLPDMSNLKNLEVLSIRHCNNLAEIRGLEGLESLIYLCLSQCHTCVKNLPKIVAQGMLPSPSDKREVQKQYLIPDDDNINGTVFFLVYELPRQWEWPSYSIYDNNNVIHINGEVRRNDGKRTEYFLELRLEGWKITGRDQFYSCYFQDLTWFGFPLKKGDILEVSTFSSSYSWYDLDVKMVGFVVADEAMEDSQQLGKGVKDLITFIRECEPKNHEYTHIPYRMPSGRREC